MKEKYIIQYETKFGSIKYDIFEKYLTISFLKN